MSAEAERAMAEAIPIMAARSAMGFAALYLSHNSTTHCDDRRGGTVGITLRLGISSGRNRKAAGYFSGFTFSSGSVDLQL
jgi:hypothetical protein